VNVIALLVRSFQRELDDMLARSQHPIVGTVAVSTTEVGYRVDLTLSLSRDAAAELLESEAMP